MGLMKRDCVYHWMTVLLTIGIFLSPLYSVNGQDEPAPPAEDAAADAAEDAPAGEGEVAAPSETDLNTICTSLRGMEAPDPAAFLSTLAQSESAGVKKHIAEAYTNAETVNSAFDACCLPKGEEDMKANCTWEQVKEKLDGGGSGPKDGSSDAGGAAGGDAGGGGGEKKVTPHWSLLDPAFSSPQSSPSNFSNPTHSPTAPSKLCTETGVYSKLIL